MKTINHFEARENNRLLFVAYIENLATEASEETRIQIAKVFLKNLGVNVTDYIECFENDYEKFLNIKFA